MHMIQYLRMMLSMQNHRCKLNLQHETWIQPAGRACMGHLRARKSRAPRRALQQGLGPARAWMLAWLARSSGTSVSRACACPCSSHSSALAAGRRAAATTCTHGSRASSCGQQIRVYLYLPRLHACLLANRQHMCVWQGSRCD